MNKQNAFTLVELLIVVTIVAVLVGVALPYYQNYVRETKITKAKHELDIIKEALIKYNTFEDKKFSGTDLNILQGNYLQQLTLDPWGRPYEVFPASGVVRSLGPDHLDPRDDIVVDYLPSLALIKATWVDADHNRHITASDGIRLEFTRFLMPGQTITYTNDPVAADASGPSLLFSPDVKVDQLGATSTPLVATISELWIPILANDDSILFPGSSTVRVASGNVSLMDFSGRLANGTAGQFPGIEVIIKAD